MESKGNILLEAYQESKGIPSQGQNKKVCHFEGFELNLLSCIVKNYINIYSF